ncbi:hypothetical protein SAMN04488057_11475 [Cyclobacterium lianum]|uniref:Uncharacterized protein n=1 Tax=Cyclobacterium lianum TaxID=388280 RepID=A0A1M7Q650_9BACT|nr:hypothetical protein SAMN04488057_11475 [Cyclobacterium lianum]
MSVKFLCILLATYFSSEFLAFWIFLMLRKKFVQKGFSLRPMILGVLERLFLYVGLIQGFGQSLILFGALKIGTRIKNDEDKISNDYFLVGNIVSVLLVFTTIAIWSYLNKI